MTKTIRFGAAGVAIAAALSMTSVAQAQSADATATAEVLQALTIVHNGTDLDFGSMVQTGAGTVSLAADNTLDCSAAAIVCSGTTSVAGFDVTGSAGENVKINLPTSVDLLHSAYVAATSGGEHVIELGSFVTDGTLVTPAVGPDYWQVTLDATTSDASFNVGGTISLDGSEVAGVYSETFTVTVEYP